jgi:drug/metabolite transporter superfamily protein YnfA
MDLNAIISYLSHGMFYVVTGILGFLGAFTVYVYIRYAKSPTLAVVVSIMYAFMFLVICGNALRLLGNT